MVKKKKEKTIENALPWIQLTPQSYSGRPKREIFEPGPTNKLKKGKKRKNQKQNSKMKKTILNAKEMKLNVV